MHLIVIMEKADTTNYGRNPINLYIVYICCCSHEQKTQISRKIVSTIGPREYNFSLWSQESLHTTNRPLCWCTMFLRNMATALDEINTWSIPKKKNQNSLILATWTNPINNLIYFLCSMCSKGNLFKCTQSLSCTHIIVMWIMFVHLK